MADDWVVHLRIEDAAGSEVESWRFSKAPTSADPGTAQIYLAHMKEAMDQYRHFATLRALIVWLPILIILTGLETIYDVIEITSTFSAFIPSTILVIAFILVFWIQRYFQKLQDRLLDVSSTAQDSYLKASKGEKVEVRSFRALIAEARDTNKNPPWDRPSKSLAWFLIIIVTMHTLVSAYLGYCEFRSFIGQEEECTQPDEGDPSQGGNKAPGNNGGEDQEPPAGQD